MSNPTELLLQEALTHLYLHRENQAHVPNADLYARIEGHLKGLRSGGMTAPAAAYTMGEKPNEQVVPVVYCKECGGAKYPWIEHHEEDCSRQYL